MYVCMYVCTTDVCVTNLKCFSDFCHFFFYFDDKSPDKQEIN